MEESRNESGRFTPEHTDEEILAAVRAHEPAATSEVAGEVGMTRQGADRRLRQLRDGGRVASKKIAASLVWFDANGDSTTATATEARDSVEDRPDPQSGVGTGSRDTVDERDQAGEDGVASGEGDDDLADAVREHLEAAGQPPKTAHGRAVILDVFRLLREHGTMPTGDLQDEIYPDYTDHWGSARTMWNAVDRYLEDIPGIEKGGYGKWAYAGDETVREALGEGRA